MKCAAIALATLLFAASHAVAGDGGGARAVIPRPAPSPPAANDVTFVVDTGPGLDTPCVYGSDGPLVINLPIGRYFGLATSYTSYSHFSPIVELEVMAYDVDSNTQPAGQERDFVRFNGRAADYGPVVDCPSCLSGANDEWRSTKLTIPIDRNTIRQPADPGEGGVLGAPAENTIRIEIDRPPGSYAAGDQWCTSIAWVALRLKAARPILLVHGIRDEAAGWGNSSPHEGVWSGWLDLEGIPYEAMSFRDDPDSFKWISVHAGELSTRIAAMRARFGVDRINIVAHSKGGLDSRHYVEHHDDVARIAMFGTPNAGSNLANQARAGLLTACTILTFIDWPAGVACFANLPPATLELTTGYMADYNRSHGPNPNARYCALACDRPRTGLDDLTFGDDVPTDGDVPVSSVHALDWMAHETYVGDAHDCTHRHEMGSSTIRSRLFQFAAEPQGSADSGFVRCDTDYAPVPARRRPSDAQDPSAGNARAAGENSGFLARSVSSGSGRGVAQTGHVVSLAETRSVAIPIDATGEASIRLSYLTGNLDLVLISPSNVVIDPAAADADPTIDFSADEGFVATMPSETYTFTAIEQGVWTAQVTGSDAAAFPDVTPFVVTAYMPDSAFAFSAATNADFYTVGDTITVTAMATQNGSPLVGVSVDGTVVSPSAAVATLTLEDDGLPPDQIAGDGEYTGELVATESGRYDIIPRAQGTAPDFSRMTLLDVAVAESGSTIGSVLAEQTSDTDGDGLHDALQLTLGLNITRAGSYIVSADLTDALGAPVATDTAEATLAVGAQQVELSFNPLAIYESGHDGPYKLTNVRLAEVAANDSPLPCDEASDVYATASYLRTEFDRPAVMFPGTGTDDGVDSDNDGVFDALAGHVDVDLVAGGSYEWTAVLVSQDGRDLGVTKGHTVLPAGPVSIPLVFDSSAIADAKVAGPYRVGLLRLDGASVSEVDFGAYDTSAYAADAFGRSARRARCVKTLRGQLADLAYGEVSVMQKCIGGVLSGSGADCTMDPSVQSKRTDLEARAAAKIAKSCPSDLVRRLGLGGSCSAARDTAALVACATSASSVATDALLDVEYADAAAALDADTLRCQQAVARAAVKHLKGALKLVAACQLQRDEGLVASCPDPVAQAKLDALRLKVEKLVTGGCSDPAVQSLLGTGFGGSCATASDANGLGACEADGHAAVAESLLELFP